MRYFPDNLGLATDLMLHQQTGVVEARDGYVVVRTPDAPDYFFGNALILPQRPSADSAQRLEADFKRLVGAPPRIAHKTLIWPESISGAVTLDAFVEEGYGATVYRVLEAHPDAIRTVTTNPRVEVRPFAVQQDWDDWARMQLADMPDPLDATTQRYIAYQETAHRTVIGRGLGNWWGAYIDGEQVGSLGLYFLDGIGRFQSVVTAEAHRNQKVCRTLVSEVIRRNAGQTQKLVMVADETYHAGAIYEALGFQLQARVASLCREPQG